MIKHMKKGRGRRRKRRKALYMDQLSELSELLISELLRIITGKLKARGVSSVFTRMSCEPRYSNRDREIDIRELARDERFVKEASYRIMGLKPGCGANAVKSRFRAMMFELRPDKAERDDKVTRALAALEASRDELLKYET